MNFEDICKELGLKVKIGRFTDYTQKYYTGIFYHTSFDMSKSLIWCIPGCTNDNDYCVAFQDGTEISVLVDIEFIGENRPIVKGTFKNYKPDDPKLKELISHGIEVLNRYEPYAKKNQINKRMGELEKDFV